MTHENIEIPNTLPAMTLRGVVLFPSAMMPLRIFEPRYREMLNDVLSQDRMFAIVREREDVSAEEVELELPYSVATAGLVRISKKHDDGTSFVLLQGLHRVRVRSILQEEPYRLLDIEPLKTEVEDSISGTRAELMSSLEQNVKLEGLVTGEILEMLNPLEDTAVLVDLAAHHVCRDTNLKQKMLEEDSLAERMCILLNFLQSENEKLAYLRESFGEKSEDGIDIN